VDRSRFGTSDRGPSRPVYAVDDSGNLYGYTVSNVAPKSTITLRDYAFVVGTSPIFSDGTYWLAIGYEDGDSSVTSVSAAGTLGTEVPFTVSPNISGIFTSRFSPNGKLLESGSDDGLFGIWNIPLPASGAPPSPAVAPNTDFIWNAGFDPTSTYVVTAEGSRSANSQLAVWSVATGVMKSRTAPTAFSWPPRSVAFSPDGAALVTGEHNCGKLAVCAY
jgi:WD40 repeat protein